VRQGSSSNQRQKDLDKMHCTHRVGALLASLILPIAQCIATYPQTINLPEGKMVMIDGRISPGEWSDAVEINLPDGARFLAKQHANFVLLAVAVPQGKNFFLDLYLSPRAGDVLDLHASAKLGERQLRNGSWPEWKWWNNEGWTANVARVDSFDEKRFFPENVREYQIERSRFQNEIWRVRLGISIGSDAEYRKTDWPVGTRDVDTRGWIELRLNTPSRSTH
jgi:hypothetical protein